MAQVTLYFSEAVAGGRGFVIKDDNGGGADGHLDALVIIPTADVWLDYIDLYVQSVTGSPPALRIDLFLAGGTGVDLYPTGNPLTTVYIPVAAVTTGNQWLTGYSFSKIRMDAGVTYLVVLRPATDGSDGSNYWNLYENNGDGDYWSLVSYDSEYNEFGTWSDSPYELTTRVYGLDYVFDPPDTPLGTQNRRLVACAGSTVWYEDK